MPFLAPLIPAIIGGVASAGAGAVASGLIGKGQNGAPGVATADQLAQAGQNTQGGLNQQQSFLNALQGLSGMGIGAQQQSLQGLQGVASGTGPNPAQAMLQQATGQNVAQQASLMGSQRGVGSNAGLLARQAGQQGSQIQQNAVGQGATLQAQQQLAALGQLGNQGYNASGQYGQALGQYQQGAQNNQNSLMQTSGALTQENNKAQNNIIGGVTNGLGGIVNQGGQALGNWINKPTPMAQGGEVPQTEATPGMKSNAMRMMFRNGGHVPGKPKVMGDNEANDTVPAMLSPGEIVVPRTKAKDPKKAAAFAAAVAMRSRKK